jgi:hypothetical protein
VTLPPIPSTAVVGVVGKPYKVGGKCAVPDCGRTVDHGHHIFRRSALAGAFFWVRLPDGQVVGNLTGLCWYCLVGVTGKRWGHTHWIQWRDGEYLWGSVRLGVEIPKWDTDFIPIGPLDPQPPAPDLLDAPQPTEESEPDRCPECGQQKRRSGSPAGSTPGAPRRRKSWIVKVPDDHEDGADVLDTLVDDLAPLLGIDPTASGRYHVLVPVLVYAHQDERGFIASIKGVGEKES